MKIIGFSQLRNELSNGNLENWFNSMSFCDYIYIYDQASDDGSCEYYKKHDNTVVIESPVNDLQRSISCKGVLLDKILSDHPDTEWIFWIDGDTILDGRLLRNDAHEVYKLLEWGTKEQIDSFLLGHYNLWRSDVHYRVDNDYDWFHKNGRHAFWRNNGKLQFLDNGGGIHQAQFPRGLSRSVRIDRDLIHRGFATDEQILNRFYLQKSFGELNDHNLYRMIDERTLAVKRLREDIIPDWYQISDTISPLEKEKLQVQQKD